MTDPPEHLADPARERLLDHPAELADRPPADITRRRLALMNLVRHAEQHDLYTATADQEPLRRVPEGRPPAEFSPRTLALIWVAAIVGLVVSVCVLVMVIAWRRALP